MAYFENRPKGTSGDLRRPGGRFAGIQVRGGGGRAFSISLLLDLIAVFQEAFLRGAEMLGPLVCCSSQCRCQLRERWPQTGDPCCLFAPPSPQIPKGVERRSKTSKH